MPAPPNAPMPTPAVLALALSSTWASCISSRTRRLRSADMVLTRSPREASSDDPPSDVEPADDGLAGRVLSPGDPMLVLTFSPWLAALWGPHRSPDPAGCRP